nr:STAS domain-containing protein [Neiella litorisoli]
MTKQGNRWQLAGAFDRFSLMSIWPQLKALPTGADVTLDLEKLGRVDSAGLAGLVQLRIKAEQQQVALSFENVPPQLCHMAHLFHVDVLLALPDLNTSKIENN